MDKLILKNKAEYNIDAVPTGDWTDTYNVWITKRTDDFNGSTHSVLMILSKDECDKVFNSADENNIEQLYRNFITQ